MSTAADTVGVLHYPWGEDYGYSRPGPKTPRRIYRRGLVYKANPRPPGYMEGLFAERHPGASLVRVGEGDWREAVRGAGRVVLLYPDSTGLGLRPLEAELRELAGGELFVLNGRRREFELDPRTRWSLRLRRALERSYAGEAVGLVLLALLTPPLLAFDLLRGRR